jgi:signal transduction histidine kinase
LVPEFGVQGDQPESILFIARDITAIKNYEIELNRKNDDLQRINEYLDNFVYAAAHDLQSPVVNLKILTTFLNDPNQQQNQTTYLNRLTSEVDRLEKTLNGLVELIRVQNMEENIRMVAFTEILDSLKEEFAYKLKECNGLIHADFSGVPTIGYIKAYLLIILRNLLSNAIKYRSPDRQLDIQLGIVKHENYVLLTFSDNGQGIDLKKNGKNLFKPFKQLSNKVEGIGLGLHLIKYTIERNGGKIELESRPGVGTTFRVYLKEY